MVWHTYVSNTYLQKRDYARNVERTYEYATHAREVGQLLVRLEDTSKTLVRPL